MHGIKYAYDLNHKKAPPEAGLKENPSAHGLIVKRFRLGGYHTMSELSTLQITKFKIIPSAKVSWEAVPTPPRKNSTFERTVYLLQTKH